MNVYTVDVRIFLLISMIDVLAYKSPRNSYDVGF